MPTGVPPQAQRAYPPPQQPIPGGKGFPAVGMPPYAGQHMVPPAPGQAGMYPRPQQPRPGFPGVPQQQVPPQRPLGVPGTGGFGDAQSGAK